MYTYYCALRAKVTTCTCRSSWKQKAVSWRSGTSVWAGYIGSGVGRGGRYALLHTVVPQAHVGSPGSPLAGLAQVTSLRMGCVGYMIYTGTLMLGYI